MDNDTNCMLHVSPAGPNEMDWTQYYPAFTVQEDHPLVSKPVAATSLDTDTQAISTNQTSRMRKDVEVVDIGCGFGGLLVALAPLLPDTLALGMWIMHAFSCWLTDLGRPRDSDLGHRVRTGADQSASRAERGHWTLPEYQLPQGQQHEVPTQFLPKGTAFQDLHLLSGPSLQSPETQGQDRFDHAQLRVCFCAAAWRHSVHHYRRRAPAPVDGRALRRPSIFRAYTRGRAGSGQVRQGHEVRNGGGKESGAESRPEACCPLPQKGRPGLVIGNGVKNEDGRRILGRAQQAQP